MMILWTTLIGIFFLNKFSYGNFSYDGIHGPSHWGDDYQYCIGKHQSPINIEEHDVKNVSFDPLVFQRLNIPHASFITNNGHTVMIQTNELKPAMVSGGPLGNNTYVFEQLHFHWGENDHEGSEDYINNHKFAMELHAVFYKQEYNSMEAAVNHSDGLAVFAYFYEVDDKQNPTYNTIVEVLPTVEMVDSKHELQEPLLLEHLLLPNNSTIANYFTYNGSLTTPPCLEIVTWIDFKDPQLLSHEQLAAFRNVRTSDGSKLTHNFRPVQPLSNRQVYHNIWKDESNKHKDNSHNGEVSIHNKVTMLITFFVSMLLITI